MNRVAEVNKALRARGAEERLARGAGYYYFRLGNAAAWPEQSVMVFRADAFSVEQWLVEYDRMRVAYENR